MDKKILITMVALVVVAVMVFAVALIASGGMAAAGGFTKLFNKLVNEDDVAYNQWLKLPDGWDEGDVKKVSDTIVDMTFHELDYGYSTTIWFVYHGDKYNDPANGRGTVFHVPDSSPDGWLYVDHGRFSVEVRSVANISDKYDVGDTITIQSTLTTNVNVDLAFDDEWHLTSEI